MKTVLRFLFFALLFLVSTSIYSQNQPKIDSLLNLLPIDNDSLTSTIYRDITKEYYYIDLEKSEFYVNKELKFAKKSKISSLINQAMANVGNHYAAAGDQANMAKWYQAAIDHLDQQKDGPEIASILNNWGITFCRKGYYDKGMVKFQEALNTVNVKWPDAPIKGECLLSLGMIHGSLKNYERSDNYLEQAIIFFTKMEDLPLLHETIMMLGVNQYENFQFQKAKNTFLKAIDYFEKTEDQFNVSKCCSNLGAVYFDLDSLDKAEYYFHKGLDIAKEIKRDHLQLIMYQRLGQVNFLKKRYAIHPISKAS